MRLFRLWDYIRTRLWFVPSLCVLAGALLSFATIAVDRSGSLLPQSVAPDPDAALSILMSVATSMVTLTGLVLTITMVVVQLAMGQFSPRVLRAILRDRPSQIAIGVFVATFAHSVLVMREVRAATGDDPGYVPGLALVVAFVLVLVSIVVLVAYVNHIGQSLRVASIIQSVGDETRDLIDKVYPREREREPASDGDVPNGAPAREIVAHRQGVLYRVAADELVDVASDADAVLELVPRVGDFVPEGAPLARVYGDGDLDEGRVARAVALGKERTMHEDVAYGVRLLVDVAQRSLTPAMGDPTTATQAIDRLHDCLRQLAQRPFPSGRCYDDEGSLRLLVPVLSWRGYVELALDELRQDANVSIQVLRRVRAMLDDLFEVAPAERRAPLQRQLELFERRIRESFSEAEDRELAREPDVQGLGSGTDVFVDSDSARSTTGRLPAARSG